MMTIPERLTYELLAVEYDYQAGDVVLRVSHLLTPDQATAYQTALKQIGG